jgi:hypothetical protein
VKGENDSSCDAGAVVVVTRGADVVVGRCPDEEAVVLVVVTCVPPLPPWAAGALEPPQAARLTASTVRTANGTGRRHRETENMAQHAGTGPPPG